MANFCPKCGKELEKDGFCLNCIEFTEKKEIMQDVAEEDTINHEEQSYVENDREAYEELMNEQLKHKSRVRVMRGIVAVMVVLVAIGVMGIFSMRKFDSETNEKNVKEEVKEEQTGDDVTEQVVILDGEETEGIEDFDYEDYDVYEADYDEIMQLGEPTNAYLLFTATKNDVIPVMDEYFIEQGQTMDYTTNMNNTYEIVDDEKVTCYETMSIWSKSENDMEMYFISSDTVTGKLLYVCLYREDCNEAIQLVRKSLETIDPSLTEEEIQTLCDSVTIDSGDFVDEICGDYEIQGTYIEDLNNYCYFIFSLQDN